MRQILDKEGIKYIDLHDLINGNTYEYLVSDGLHLNDAGYNKVTSRIYDWMNTL